MSQRTVSTPVVPVVTRPPLRPRDETDPPKHTITPVTLSWAEEYAASRLRAPVTVTTP
jgi:hypothetical protein